MPPNKRKVAAACKAMKRFGIPEDEVKPALNELLELYNNKWTLIEEDHYKVLLDVLLEKKKEEDKGVNSKQNDELEVDELPTKRLCNRHQKEHTSARVANSRSQPKRASVRRRAHQDETKSSSGSHTCSEPEDSEPLVRRLCPKQQEGPALVPVNISYVDTSNSLLVTTSSTRAYLDKPKLSSSSQSCSVLRDSETRKRQKWPEDEPSEPHLFYKRAKSSSLSFQEKEKTSVTHQVALISERGTGIEPLEKLKVGPYMDHTPVENVLAMYHNNSLDLPDGASNENGSNAKADGLEFLEYQSLDMVDKALQCVSGFSNGKSTDVEEDGLKFLEPESLNEEDKGDCVSEVLQFDIASSPKGEVKISLTCNSSGRSDFHVPSLDAFLKMVEKRILKLYRITEPNFSLLKLMTEFCDFFWALGTESAVDEHLRSLNLPARKICFAEETHDDKDGYGGNYCIPSSLLSGLVKISDAQEIHDDKYGYGGNYCIPSSLSSGLVRFQNLFEVIPQIPKPIALSGLGGLHCIAGFNIKYIENICGESERRLKILKDPHPSNSCKVEAVRKRHCPFPFLKYSDYVDDITGGEEKVKISLLNGRSPEDLPTFKYISHNLVHDKANVNFSLAHISDEDCCSHCFGDCLSLPIPCACARETGGELAYMPGGLVKEKFLKECVSMNLDTDFCCQKCPLERSKNKDSDKCKGHLLRRFIKECWFKCKCSKKCGNRVVQHGISANLQVFLTAEGKGWGLRTLEELPRGAFVCEYVGEIITSSELHERNLQSSGNENHTYSVPLDADLKDEEALYLDATAYGNVARFINHRCHDATLVAIPVEVETPNRHYYHLAFFTRMKIEAMEELTWDYGIDFDDHDHPPVKAFECLCGSQFCRGLNL